MEFSFWCWIRILWWFSILDVHFLDFYDINLISIFLFIEIHKLLEMKWIEKEISSKIQKEVESFEVEKWLYCPFQISNNNLKPLSNKYEEIRLQEST